MSNIDFGMIAIIAFTGSMGHCIGMCGGFVVAYTSAKITPSMSKTSQLIRHLYYNLGRVSSYAVMGAIFGAFGMVFSVSMEFHGALFLLAGVLMVFTALAMSGVSKLLLSIEYSMGKMPMFKRLFSRLIKSEKVVSFFALGALNGLFPCGFVYFFAAKAAATATPFYGMLVMIIFGLSTIPVLTFLGQSVGLLRSLAFRQTMNRIAAFSILLYGLWTIYSGLAYFFELPI